MYHTTCNYNNSRMFTFNPANKCTLGNYFFRDGDSSTAKFCNNPENWPNISSQMCSVGFNGKPIQFRYSTESDSNWRNERCCGPPGIPNTAGITGIPTERTCGTDANTYLNQDALPPPKPLSGVF